MCAASATFEAVLRLLSEVTSKDILKPLLLMPAGPPEAVLSQRIGFGTTGETVADAAAALHRAAERYQKQGAVLNEVNEEGIHVSVDPALSFVIFVETTCERVQEVLTKLNNETFVLTTQENRRAFLFSLLLPILCSAGRCKHSRAPASCG
jgi:hypothetical protein